MGGGRGYETFKELKKDFSREKRRRRGANKERHVVKIQTKRKKRQTMTLKQLLREKKS